MNNITKYKTLLKVFGFIAIWEAVHYANILEGEIPSFFVIIYCLFNEDTLIELIEAFFNSMIAFTLSAFFGVTIGYLFGVLMGAYKFIRELFYGIFNSLKSVPVTVLIPVFLILFGLDAYYIFLITVPPLAIVAVNISDSYYSTNLTRKTILKFKDVSPLSFVKHIFFWDSLDILYSTLRVVVTYVLALEVALDYFMNTSDGLGHFVRDNYNSANTYPQMYLAIFIVAILGITLVSFINIISEKTLLWKKMI
jgi:ABC-type nitrate/sulfonate/bicarbonate transport system permease component